MAKATHDEQTTPELHGDSTVNRSIADTELHGDSTPAAPTAEADTELHGDSTVNRSSAESDEAAAGSAFPLAD